MNIKVVQYNLGRGRAATHECLREATSTGVHILLLQEPYVGAGARMSVAAGCRVVQGVGDVNDPIRSAIVITNPEIKYTENINFLTRDISGVILRIGSIRLGIVSIYLDKELDLDEYLATVKRIVEEMRVERVLVAGDVNAKSHWWGCAEEDSRGLAISELFAELGLEVLNSGHEPTFLAQRHGQPCASIIDVTACSARLLPAAAHWRVDDRFGTLSDHRPIALTLRLRARREDLVEDGNTTRIYNTKKAEWMQFRETFQRELERLELESRVAGIEDREGVNGAAEEYTQSIIASCEAAIPRIPSKRPVRACKWWTAELARMKAEMVRRRRRVAKANPQRRRFVVDQYLEARTEYKTAIESAITKSWKEFCSGEKIETTWQRSYRIMKACTPRLPDRLLEDPSGNTLNERGSATLLADTFFSRDDAANDTMEQALFRDGVSRMVEEIAARTEAGDIVPFTGTELETVLRSMSPKKAPGGDGLTLDICLTAYACNRTLLLDLFSQCLRWGCFPRIWKTATIKVIPKPARDKYTTPKSYRPIGLLPVLGKMLEKLFVNRLQWQLGRTDSLSPLQYGFTPQRSTEDALYDALTMVRSSLQHKEIVVMVSLDIEGAFDNAWWPAILNGLHFKGIDPSVMRLVINYLSERTVKLRYAGETIERNTNKGCIQGSTCGPILWNIQMDPLLEQSQYGGVRVQAFADDILMIAAGADGSELEGRVNRALAVILQWGKRLKLKFAPGKTQALIVTKKMRYHTPQLVMAGVTISYGTSLRILGLTIDPLLNFRQHLEAQTKKAIDFYKIVSRAARAQWGLSSDILRLIYIAVVEPTVLYAASSWADITKRLYAETALNRLTRCFALKLSKAHRTVSFTSSVLLAGILPLTLRAQEQALIYKVKRGEPLADLPGRAFEHRRSPFSLPHPAERKRLAFGTMNSQEDAEGLVDEGPVLFTDGSKLDGKVGAAITCWTGVGEVQHTTFRLENFCSVLQAELAAILRALVMAGRRRERHFNIASDSRSSLEMISDPNSVHPLAADIRQRISLLHEEGKRVSLTWVRAHCGIPGNERADELAKHAALNNRQQPGYDRFPLSFAKHSIRSDTISEWQLCYESSPTGTTTKAFFKDVAVAHRILRHLKMDNYLAQIFTGHGGFRHYLHRFKLIESPLCSCEDVSQTILHLLIQCPMFGGLRHDCESAMETNITENGLHNLLLDDDCRRLFLTFAKTILRKVGKQNGSYLEPV